MKPLPGLIAFAALALAVTAAAQTPPVPTKLAPTNVSGAKIPDGVRIKSQQLENPFSIDIAGKQIRALSAERLQWDVDGKTIELELAMFPRGAAQSHSEEDLLRIYREWELAATKRDGWEPTGTVETFACGTSKVCLGWATRRAAAAQAPEAFRHAASIMNNEAVIVLSATAAGAAQERELKTYLQSVMRTVKREEPPAPTVERRPGINDPDFKGATLPELLYLNAGLLGETFGGLVNKTLMTAKDGQPPNVVPLDPAALMEFARFMLESGLYTNFQIIVFDGRNAHSVVLTGLRPQPEAFEYIDPAGGKEVVITGAGLERVFYAAMLPMNVIIQAFRLFALLEGAPEYLIGVLAELRAQDAKDTKQTLLSEEQLRKLARYLHAKKKQEQALAVYRAIVALDPASKQAAEDLAGAYREAGRAPPRGPAAPTRQLLSDITKTDFFTFFNLRRVDAQSGEAGETVISFKPQADKFRELVSVLITVDGEERVVKRELVLSRSFINDPREGIFARDIAKNHLSASVDRDEQPEIAELVDEIFGTARAAVAIPAATRQNATVPRLPSSGYLAFMGRRKDYQRKLTRSALTMANRTAANVPVLSILVVKSP